MFLTREVAIAKMEESKDSVRKAPISFKGMVNYVGYQYTFLNQENEVNLIMLTPLDDETDQTFCDAPEDIRTWMYSRANPVMH